MPFSIVRGDITRMEADAIVNAANSGLQRGGGVCGAIFAAAGAEEMEAACARIGFCDVGRAVATPGFRLKAKYVIHAVGPVWQGGGADEKQLLSGCYLHALELAKALGCASIAFPLISSGIYGYPWGEALSVAAEAIGAFLLENDMQATLVIYDAVPPVRGFRPIQRYLDRRLAEARPDAEPKPCAPMPLQDMEEADRERRMFDAEYSASPGMPTGRRRAPRASLQRRLKDLVEQADESFSKRLLRLIDEKGMTDVEAYRRANLDRRLFSKIRSDKGYRPSKATALSLAIALRLSLDETRDLLRSAGYALSPADAGDLIVEYFISSGSYDIFEINAALFAFDQPTLGV